MRNPLKTNVGFVYAIVAAVLFGASTPLAKQLLNDISPIFLAGLLYLGSGLGISLILLAKHFIILDAQAAKFNSTDWMWLTIATVVGGVISPVLLMIGLVKIPASTASLLLNLESLFTALIAWTLFKEHTTPKLIVGMILIVIGGVILTWSNHFYLNNLSGAGFIAMACLGWAVDNNVTRNISAADPLKIVAIKSSIAGLTNIGLASILGVGFPIYILYVMTSLSIGFVGYGLSLICFILALRNIGTARTSAYFSLAPFVGAGLSIILLSEPLTWQLILGALVMGSGVWLHLTEYHEHEHEHKILIHSHEHIHDEHHQHEHPDGLESAPHTHDHRHDYLRHSHPHYPDIHHRHKH